MNAIGKTSHILKEKAFKRFYFQIQIQKNNTKKALSTPRILFAVDAPDVTYM